jgi:hypothetical protein
VCREEERLAVGQPGRQPHDLLDDVLAGDPADAVLELLEVLLAGRAEDDVRLANSLTFLFSTAVRWVSQNEPIPRLRPRRAMSSDELRRHDRVLAHRLLRRVAVGLVAEQQQRPAVRLVQRVEERGEELLLLRAAQRVEVDDDRLLDRRDRVGQRRGRGAASSISFTSARGPPKIDDRDAGRLRRRRCS